MGVNRNRTAHEKSEWQLDASPDWNSSPMQLDEPIQICDYDPVWAERFAQEAPGIWQAVGNWVVGVEPFGSTAVPGLAAKPIVDILVGLKQYPPPDAAILALEQTGYEYLGEAGLPGRLYFRKRRPLAFNLALVVWGGQLWRDNLLLRDYLCCQPEARRVYAHHKRAIVAAGSGWLLAYSEQKAPVVADLRRRAEVWAQQTGWQPRPNPAT